MKSGQDYGESHHSKGGRIAEGESICDASISHEVKDGSCGTCVPAKSHGHKGAGDEAEHGDGDGGETGRANHVGVKWFDVSNFKRCVQDDPPRAKRNEKGGGDAQDASGARWDLHPPAPLCGKVDPFLKDAVRA